MKPHKHSEFIKSWAEGKEIQCRSGASKKEWRDVSEEHPIWHDHCEYRIKPEPQKYPQTKMTDDELLNAFDLSGAANIDRARNIANAAIARAIEDKQVFTADDVKAAINAANIGMVPVDMLEKVYNRAIEAAAERLQHKSWTASPNGYDPNAKRIILDELMNINRWAIIDAVKEAK